MKHIWIFAGAISAISVASSASAQGLPSPFDQLAPAQEPQTPETASPAAGPNGSDTAVRSPMPRMSHHGMAHGPLTIPVRIRARKVVHRPVDQLKVAEHAGFKKVSDLVAFPPFFPGLGIVMVKPDTLPVGPFRTFDRKDRLIATVYMLPLKDMDDHKKWDYVKGLPAPADHATFYFHPGHPGVEMPHYHLVIWHVSKKDEDLVAK